MSQRHLSVALCALAATVFCSSAFAGGLPDDEGGYKDTGGYDEPLPLWTGFYAGVHAGYADGEWDGDLKTRHDKKAPWGPSWPDSDANDATVDGDGWFGGGQIGYNWQRNNLVLGVEGDLSWTDFDGESGPHAKNDKFNKTLKAELDYFGTARIRLGYAAGRFMPYLTGGLAWGESEIEQEVFYAKNNGGLDDPDGYVSGRGDASETHFGWTIGGGVEAMLGDGWSAKAEYLYVDLGEEEYAFKGTHYNADGSVHSSDWGQDGFDTDLDFHTIRVGINYQLN